MGRGEADLRRDTRFAELPQITFQASVVVVGDTVVMGDEQGDRLGFPQVPQKGTFAVTKGGRLADAVPRIRAKEGGRGREEEHTAQRNKCGRAMQFPDEVASQHPRPTRPHIDCRSLSLSSRICPVRPRGRRTHDAA